MATRTRRSPETEPSRFWQKAFDAGCRLLAAHDGKRLPPTGAVHYAADFADRSVEEFLRRWGPRR